MTLSPTAALVTLAYAGVHSYFFFYFPLIDMGLFKDRVVAMGKPTATTPFATLDLVQPLAFIPRSLSLPKGGQRMRSSSLGI